MSLVVSWQSLFVDARAYADDSWHAPAGCPSRASAQARLRALGADPSLLQDAYASVWFDVSATGEQRARVRLRHAGQLEQRVLYDSSCAALAEAALVVISLAFENERVVPEASPPARHRFGLALAPLARLDVGSLPRATLGFGGALRVGTRRLLGELEGSYFLSREGERDDGRAGGRFGLVSGAARVCYALTERWLSACSALELGRANGRAVDTSVSYEARAAWAAVLLGLALGVPTKPVVPRLMVELGVPFLRPVFDVERAGQVFQASPAILRVSLQVELELRSARP